MVSLKVVVLVGSVLAFPGLHANAQEVLHVARGAATDDRFGNAVSGGGDVDGDGHPDLLIAAYTDSATAPEQGAVRVVSGWTGQELYTVRGSGRDGLGISVAFVGDVDGDSRADFVAGATQSLLGGAPLGYARMYSGATGSVLWNVTGPHAQSDFGCSVASVGDIDGDGRPDVAVGARYAGLLFNLERCGHVYVYSGATGSLLRDWSGNGAQKWFGWSVAGAGDLDGDGCPEIAVGVVGWDEPGKADCGALEIRSGCSGALLRRHVGLAANESVGWSIAGGGDLDGDGTNDVVAGVPSGTFDGIALSGGARAYSGASGNLLRAWGGGIAHSFCGQACAIVGDTDGDGSADVALGSPGQPVGWTCGGRADLYSGSTGLLLRSMCGEGFGDSLGAAVAAAGDVNADGYADWIAGAPYNDAQASNAGAAYAASGFACAAPTTYCIGLPNSLGSGARIGWSGSASLAWNRLVLTCGGIPPGGYGRFYFGTSQAQVLFGDGYRCVGGTTWRLPIRSAGPAGTIEFALDVNALPGGVQISAGTTRHFQYWYRNVLPGGSGFNLSDGLAVTFCP